MVDVNINSNYTITMKTPSEAGEAGKARREAISYLRFSSKEQELGDSERRQIAHSERWCSEHGYTLSKEAYADRGRSALHGKHRTTGSLGRLLKAAKPGSLILIENLDRWSREDDLDSQLELRKAVNSGVELMFLSENLLVTKANFNDLNVRCVVFFGAVRAHGESVRKSQLQAANWEKKHAAAKAGKPVRLNRPPCWLQWNQDAGKYEEDKAKAAVVRSLFELAGAGHGLLSIVRIMKAKGTPPLTTGASAAWNLSTLRRVLLSKEALGFYCPTDGGQPVSGFFPAVVTEAQYYAAQGRLAIAKQVKRTLKRGDANLFTGLAFCTCGGGCAGNGAV
jgi:DNA invertase Pin-like site-specific DNA recombinase